MTLNSDWVLPIVIAGVLLWGVMQRTPVYDSFVQGAGKGIKTALSVLPCLVAVMVAVEMMKASGALQLLCNLLSAPLSFLGIQPDVAPLVIVRPFSGMASLSILDSIFHRLGPDSPAARTASAIMGSTETIFYTVAIYFGAVGVKRSRYTIPVSLLCLLVSMIVSGIVCRWL